MGLFHRHKWEETSIIFKISSSPAESVYEHVVRRCRKCGERQSWMHGAWVKTDKSIELTKRVYHKAIELMTELMKEEIDE